MSRMKSPHEVPQNTVKKPYLRAVKLSKLSK